MPEQVIPSAIFATSYEATEGEWDVPALMDAFLWQMATRRLPARDS
jgi:hypothetical protein